jgi:hypothetical protein
MSFDLSGFLYIQKNYVYDLSAISQISSGDIVTQKVNQLQKDLGSLYNNYSNANTSAQKTLTHQDEMLKIVDNEKKRLDAKKNQINDAVSSRLRIIDLNNSSRKRQEQYVNIFVIIVITLLIYIALINIQYYLPIIPDVIITLLSIILFSISALYVITIIQEINRREPTNYDNLKLSPPANANKSQIDRESAAEKGDLLGSLGANLCIGETCCSDNTTWNSGTAKCIIKCNDSKKPINLNGKCIAQSACTKGNKICGKSCIPEGDKCYETESFQNLEKKIESFEPYEYSSYSKI